MAIRNPDSSRFSKMKDSRFSSKSAAAVAVVMLVISFLTLFYPVTHGFIGGIQECKNSTAPTGTSLTCVFGSNPASGDELICGFTYLAAGLHHTGFSDSLSTSFTRQLTTLTTGSHALNSSLWIGTTTSTGADTVTVTISGTTDIEISCAEFSGTTNTVVTTKSATGTSTTNALNFPLAVASFTPTIGDLVYVYGSGDPCGGSSTKTYSDVFASATANSITENILGVCRTLGAVQFKLGQVNEYAAWPSSTATTAPITWSFNTQQGVNTGEWSELVIELAATQFTTTVTTTSTVTTTTTSTTTSTSTTTKNTYPSGTDERWFAAGIVVVFIIGYFALTMRKKGR